MYVIETANLNKQYESNCAVVDLNLKVERGSVYGFLGPNGSGKTTTVKMLLGMRKPTNGSVKVLGYNSITEGEEICKQIGYVPENGNLYPSLTVGDTISFIRQLRPSWDTKLEQRLMEMFKLPLTQRVSKLSKGMQRQLGLLLAMAPRPELLIFDEPTSGLDPVKRHEVLQVLMDTVAETGQTVFFSSHNMSEVERVADTVGIIHNGTLRVSSNLEDLKASVRRVRVVIPEMRELKLTSPARHVEGGQGQWVITVDQGIDNLLAELNTFKPSVLDIYDLSLEDIFLIYAGGER